MNVGPRSGLDEQRELANLVVDQVRGVVPQGFCESVTLDSSLYELGLDSLTRMGVVNHLEKSFGIRVSEESLYDIETCRDLVDIVAASMCQDHQPRQVVQPASSATPLDPSPPQSIPVEHYDVSQFPECVAFQERLARLAADSLESPFFRVKQRIEKSTATVNGQVVTSYTSFDYLGMAQSKQVTTASQKAISLFGTSASASRLVGGDNIILTQLDQALADFLGTEAAIVFPSGFGTNASLLGHLFGPDDLILYDELAHASIVQGSLLSQAKRRALPHNDVEFLDDLLQDIRGQHRRVVVAIEGVYSMDGDYPNLPALLEVKRRHKALLYVDEAHSLGVLGSTGRGICEHFGVDPADGDIWMGTVSKALGSAGGYIAGNGRLIQYLKHTTPAFVFSTATSPANAAAALAALRCLQEEPERIAQLRDRSQLFLKLARDSGLDTGTSQDTPIIPIILGDSTRCIQVSHQLLRHGVDAQPIFFPAVPESGSRIRFFITAEHTEEQIAQTVELLARLVAEVDSSVRHDEQIAEPGQMRTSPG